MRAREVLGPACCFSHDGKRGCDKSVYPVSLGEVIEIIHLHAADPIILFPLPQRVEVRPTPCRNLFKQRLRKAIFQKGEARVGEGQGIETDEHGRVVAITL